MSLSLNGKVGLITGASSGIGLATALTFVRLGAKVVLCARSLEGLQTAAKLCLDVTKDTNVVLTIQADLAVPEDRERVIAETVQRFGRLDVLVNNAGLYIGCSIEHAGVVTAYDQMFELNVKAPLHLIRLAVPHLAATRGSIVNVSSIAGHRAIPGRIGYSMSKAALDQITECTALELASKGIRVNSVRPGLTRTDFLLKCGMNKEEVENMYSRAAQTHPLGRAGEPEDVAKAIAFLASDASRFISGSNLPVDGGRQATCLR